MTALFFLVASLTAQAAEPDSAIEDPGFSRDSAGVAEALGGQLSSFQECLADMNGQHAIRLLFMVTTSGSVENIRTTTPERNRSLEKCLAEPLVNLQFAAGEEIMPVEIPFQLETEEDYRVVSASEYREEQLARAEQP